MDRFFATPFHSILSPGVFSFFRMSLFLHAFTMCPGHPFHPTPYTPFKLLAKVARAMVRNSIHLTYCALIVGRIFTNVLQSSFNSPASSQRPTKRVRLQEPHTPPRTHLPPSQMKCTCFFPPINHSVHVLRQCHPRAFLANNSTLQWSQPLSRSPST